MCITAALGLALHKQQDVNRRCLIPTLLRIWVCSGSNCQCDEHYHFFQQVVQRRSFYPAAPPMQQDVNRLSKVQRDALGAETFEDYWDVGKGLLKNPNKFLKSLFDYDKENIPEQVIEKITEYVENDQFQPEVIARVSKAGAAPGQTPK